MDTLNHFIEDIQMQREWRGNKAAEWPDDDRNARSADALEGLAKWVHEHQDTPVVKRLVAALEALYAAPDNFARFAPTVAERLGRYGFHGSVPNPDTPESFLTALTDDIHTTIGKR